MPPKKYEMLTLYTVMLLPIVIFTLSPSHISGDWEKALNQFMDNYLLGNGYYLPSNYPFAAKITNNFGTVLAVLTAVVLGFWRLKETLNPKHLPSWKISLVILFLMFFLLNVSITPQEFKVPRGRVSMQTEAFHSNYFGFLFLMISKNTMIYCGIRWIFVVYMSYRKKVSKSIP